MNYPLNIWLCLYKNLKKGDYEDERKRNRNATTFVTTRYRKDVEQAD
ncbi:hypothetical protein GCM10011339_19730 [Echinicola rosea]|uniref:Uncharacterized protein n=1 Tax=Echinicola rosea TaxID=1807691 RepID=A0ABQ1UZ96_9BACT|nr:hypothetical protein GCM10011339_19730 [Echinicola rosea]